MTKDEFMNTAPGLKAIKGLKGNKKMFTNFVQNSSTIQHLGNCVSQKVLKLKKKLGPKLNTKRHWGSLRFRNNSNIHGYLSADIIFSEKRTVFRERSFEEQIISNYKYPCIFLRQIESIGIIVLLFQTFKQMCWRSKRCSFQKVQFYLTYV